MVFSYNSIIFNVKIIFLFKKKIKMLFFKHSIIVISIIVSTIWVMPANSDPIEIIILQGIV